MWKRSSTSRTFKEESTIDSTQPLVILPLKNRIRLNMNQKGCSSYELSKHLVQEKN